MDYSILLICIFVLLFTGKAHSEIICVDVHTGNDSNPGTLELPLKTIGKAVDIINNSTEDNSTTIKVAPGLYALEDCVIRNQHSYNEKNRLVIEALILPDNEKWKPEDMPILFSSKSIPIDTNKKYIESSGLEVEISHVTIRGLKFIGSPIPKLFYYPVYRKNASLEDLIITQCMFISSPQLASSNVGVLANGHSLKIDHCVFYGCANAVVYWDAEGGISKGNSMTHCIIDGGYVSGVWLCQTDEDFEFHHNIITNCKYAFMRNEDNTRNYKLIDCIITNYEFYSGKSNNDFNLSETGKEIKYFEKNVIRKGNLQLNKGWGLDLGISKDYLHVVRGTQGSELNAGLFNR